MAETEWQGPQVEQKNTKPTPEVIGVDFMKAKEKYPSLSEASSKQLQTLFETLSKDPSINAQKLINYLVAKAALSRLPEDFLQKITLENTAGMTEWSLKTYIDEQCAKQVDNIKNKEIQLNSEKEETIKKNSDLKVEKQEEWIQQKEKLEETNSQINARLLQALKNNPIPIPPGRQNQINISPAWAQKLRKEWISIDTIKQYLYVLSRADKLNRNTLPPDLQFLCDQSRSQRELLRGQLEKDYGIYHKRWSTAEKGSESDDDTDSKEVGMKDTKWFDAMLWEFEKDFNKQDSDIADIVEKAVTTEMLKAWKLEPSALDQKSRSPINLPAEFTGVHFDALQKYANIDMFTSIFGDRKYAFALLKYIKLTNKEPSLRRPEREKRAELRLQKYFLDQTQHALKPIIAEQYFSHVADMMKIWGKTVFIDTQKDAIKYEKDGSIQIVYHTDEHMTWHMRIDENGEVFITDIMETGGNDHNENVMERRDQQKLIWRLPSIKTMMENVALTKKNDINTLWTNSLEKWEADSYDNALMKEGRRLTKLSDQQQINMNILHADMMHNLQVTKACDALVDAMNPYTKWTDVFSKYFAGEKSAIDKKNDPNAAMYFELQNAFRHEDATTIAAFINSVQSVYDKKTPKWELFFKVWALPDPLNTWILQVVGSIRSRWPEGYDLHTATTVMNNLKLSSANTPAERLSSQKQLWPMIDPKSSLRKNISRSAQESDLSAIESQLDNAY
jgi:hypothetical protein